MLSLIVARAENGVIGSKNDLPWYLSADLRRFKELTTDHTVVMGRKTYESIMTRLGRALPDRRNVVLTRQALDLPGAEVIHDVRDIEKFDDAFVVGGAEVYRATIDLADRLYITEVHADIDGDAHFPVIDAVTWREVAREPHVADEKNQFDYDFVEYERINDANAL